MPHSDSGLVNRICHLPRWKYATLCADFIYDKRYGEETDIYGNGFNYFKRMCIFCHACRLCVY